MMERPGRVKDFPSFSEGLSLRPSQKVLPGPGLDFPSFSEGLSLRPENPETNQAP